MKNIKKIISELKDEDFYPELMDSWFIYYKEYEFSLEKTYMNNTAFPSEKMANDEKDRIIRHRVTNNQKPYFLLEVRNRKSRRLKKPISIT